MSSLKTGEVKTLYNSKGFQWQYYAIMCGIITHLFDSACGFLAVFCDDDDDDDILTDFYL